MGSKNAVLIIGAGAAGLAAARDLAATGIEIAVIEARERVGGRIHTLRQDSSIIPVEFGAEFVHGKHPHLLKVIDEAGATMCDVGSDRPKCSTPAQVLNDRLAHKIRTASGSDRPKIQQQVGKTNW